MVDLAGPALAAEERELLAHPAVGGVLLFGRNYVDRGQLAALVAEIKSVRRPPLLVAVDHEGGRVQRFRHGFTALPPAAALGALWRREPARARRLAEAAGRIAGEELRAVGIGLDFAPVLDLGRHAGGVIGDRAFAADPEAVALLAGDFLRGLRGAGVEGVAKHFPGHGGVTADSHRELPEDRRAFAELALADLVPFERLAAHGLAAVMTAHVRYPAVDDAPATFSRRWIGGVLRGRLGFQGAVVSDDLSMAAAAWAGDAAARARAAVAAGCDLVIVANDREAQWAAARALEGHADPAARLRLARLHGHPVRPWTGDREAARAALAALVEAPELELDG